MQSPSRVAFAAIFALSPALPACSHSPRPVAPVPATAAVPAVPAASAAVPAQVPAAAPAAPAAPAAAAASAAAAAAAPAAASAPSDARTAYVLAGEWEWSALYRDEHFAGTLSLQQTANAWTGTMRVNGEFDAVVRSGAVTGNTVRVEFDSPQGDLVLVAVFTDPDTLCGRVDVLMDGESAAFSAHRR